MLFVMRCFGNTMDVNFIPFHRDIWLVSFPVFDLRDPDGPRIRYACDDELFDTHPKWPDNIIAELNRYGKTRMEFNTIFKETP